MGIHLMDGFSIASQADRVFEIRVEEVTGALTAQLVDTVIEIDNQTFSESTFSRFSAASLLRHGRVFLLFADAVVIGSCACMRCWEQPDEVLMLSMGIRPGWRGRGLGQRFVNGVLHALREAGEGAVRLMVGTENRRAIRIYEDVGFQVVESHDAERWTDEQLVTMRLVLSEDLSRLRAQARQ